MYPVLTTHSCSVGSLALLCFCFLSFASSESTVGYRLIVPVRISRISTVGSMRLVSQSTFMQLVSIQRTAFSHVESGIRSSNGVSSAFSQSMVLRTCMSILNRTLSNLRSLDSSNVTLSFHNRSSKCDS